MFNKRDKCKSVFECYCLFHAAPTGICLTKGNVELDSSLEIVFTLLKGFLLAKREPFQQPLIEMIERLHLLTVSVLSLSKEVVRSFNEKYFCDSEHEPI